MFNFKILKRDKKTRARVGIIKTSRGIIHTPAFVPVATKGALRGISFEMARKYGAEIFIINTYHLFRNQRFKIIEKFGGLHKYLKINFPLMTDSGGFQIFSLGFGSEQGVGKIANIFPEEEIKKKRPKGKNFVRIYQNGVKFSNPFDGKILNLTPELSIKTQISLSADIIFAFDECTSPLSSYQYTKEALQRTHNWAKDCLKVFKKYSKGNQALFGIIQGGYWRDLREESARFISSLPFSGLGIGGSLGKSKKDFHNVLDWTIPLLPENKPRHLLGIGEIEDILEAVKRGVDLFDCVIPTRLARHGAVLTSKGRINIRSVKYLKDKKPLDKNCQCNVCKNYSRSYLCHLIREKEIYGIVLLTEHNLAFLLNFIKKIREAIKNNKLYSFKNYFND